MRRYAFLIFLFLSFTISAQDYYLSNSLAMEMEYLESIDDIVIDQVEWLLKVERRDKQKISSLYKFGIEQKVIIREYNSNGTLDFYSESIDGILIEETDYDDDGKILESRTYNNDGTFDSLWNYLYDIDEELLKIEKKDKSGSVLSAIDYSFRDDGSIRSFFEYEEDSLKHREIWNSYNGEISMEMKAGDLLRDIVYYNDLNKVDSILQYDDDLLVYEEKYYYDNKGQSEKIEKYNYLTSYRIEILMNKNGYISTEKHYQKELLLFTTQYNYNDYQVIRKEKTGSGLREKWLYFYIDEQISEEVYYKQGVLIEKKKYTDPETGSYTLELFNKGEIFMNLVFEDDVKVREEYFEGGEIVRSRDLGDL